MTGARTEITTDAIVVTGFLGAGKSALAARLRHALPGRAIAEASGCCAPPPGPEGSLIVAVADAANLSRCLDDPLVGPLVAAQIRAAGLVVLARTDLVPGGDAMSALARLDASPVVELEQGGLPADLAERIARLRGRPADPHVAPAAAVAFAEWQYSGRADLTESALDTLLGSRPDGAYRMVGTVRCGKAGVEVEVVGRLRQTRPVPLPSETTLAVTGPRARFRPDRMALHFSEAVAARGWAKGLFGHR